MAIACRNGLLLIAGSARMDSTRTRITHHATKAVVVQKLLIIFHELPPDSRQLLRRWHAELPRLRSND